MSYSTASDTPLRSFRDAVYTAVLGHRKDSLFELTEAVLCAERPEPLVAFSLQPVFRRGWASTCDALADGTVDADALRHLCVQALPAPAAGARALWAVDGTIYPRAEAATSPARTWERRAVAGAREAPLVPGWAYQWLVALPVPGTSWVLPLDVRRRRPPGPVDDQANEASTALLLAQVAAVLDHRPADAPRPLVLADSGYSAGELAEAIQGGLAVDALVRLRKRRTFYRAPGPYAGMGTPRKHGAPFRTHDPATWGAPTATATSADPARGELTVAVWTNLHDPATRAAPFTVVRVTAEHGPGGRPYPAALWLAWLTADATVTGLPVDLVALWRWYAARFQIEQGFRFTKQHLGWTRLHLRHPAATDRWTHLVSAVWWQLRLARPLVTDQRLPWQPVCPAARGTPGRVRRAFVGLLPGLGSPARAPRQRGKSPGRPPGYHPPPAPRYSVVRRPPRTGQCPCHSHQSRKKAA